MDFQSHSATANCFQGCWLLVVGFYFNLSSVSLSDNIPILPCHICISTSIVYFTPKELLHKKWFARTINVSKGPALVDIVYFDFFSMGTGSITRLVSL